MNDIRMLTIIVRRTFSRKSMKPSKSKTSNNHAFAGIRNKIKLMKNDVTDIDPDDLSEFESDFMTVGSSHKMHEWEMQKKKERLKEQITVQKYFQEKEPRFLTFADTQLIRKLYETNPEEWTIERLSESFPALPQTIQKILHAKWSPKSVERVMQYDNVAIENWKKFHAKKLPMNPILEKHLTKFKERKIILSDRESLAKQFVAPKPEFPKPKSQLFSNIIQICSNEKQNDERLLSEQKDLNQTSTIPEPSDQTYNLSNANVRSDRVSHKIVKGSEKFMLSKQQNLGSAEASSQMDCEKHDLTLFNKTNKMNNKMLTFDEFMKKNLKNIHKESPEEGITLLNVYRKQVEATVSDNAVTNVEETKNNLSKVVQNKSDCAISENKDNYKNKLNISIKEDGLDTYVKRWDKKIDTELEYAKPIKIAKNMYKSGMTYRINDCYYDDDGEFLYRVPGVQS